MVASLAGKGGAMTNETRPEFCTDEHLEFLDRLRESGTTNMFGGAAHLEVEFPDLAEGSSSFHSSPKARAVLS